MWSGTGTRGASTVAPIAERACVWNRRPWARVARTMVCWISEMVPASFAADRVHPAQPLDPRRQVVLERAVGERIRQGLAGVSQRDQCDVAGTGDAPGARARCVP